jgi:outer membrane protein OmpA-like peptidoglycan-associated protein
MEKLEEGRPLLLVGVIGLALTLLFTTFFGPHSVSRIDARTQAAADGALTAGKFGWAKAEAKGQKVVLTGAAPTDQQASAAAHAVLASMGHGGVISGGVSKVLLGDLDTAPVVSPYAWHAQKDAGSASLEGFAPTRGSLGMISQAARALFGPGVSNRMSLASGAPEGVAWEVAAIYGMEALSKLESGSAELIDNRLTIRGVAANDAAVEEIRSKLAAGPAGVEAVLDIAGPSAPADAVTTVDVDASGGDKSEACEAAFARVMAAGTIRFDSGQATISQESGAVLDQLVAVARQCAELRIEVQGHTDLTGRRADNVRLSQRRAAAVKAYFETQGLPAERITARGFGATQPEATNRTAEGRARNRRIEFKVSSAGMR